MIRPNLLNLLCKIDKVSFNNVSKFSRSIGLNSFFRSYSEIPSNADTSYTVTEVQIPAPEGNYVAGKLWKGVKTACNDPNITPTISPIICLHGWLDNACSFDPLLPLIIKPNMTALALDLPGHGFSSHLQGSHSDPFMEGFITIARAIRHFGWEKVILLSHSLGSVISYVTAGVFPEVIDGYIALDNLRPIPRDIVRTLRSATKVLFEVETKLSKRLPPPAYPYDEIVQKSYLGRDKSITIEGIKILLQRGAVQRPDGKYHFTHDLRVTIPTGMGRFSEGQSMLIGSKIRCPVCIIKGEPGNDYESRELFLQVVDNIKQHSGSKVEFHLVPGTHHFHLNTPELVAPIINNFLWK